MAWRMTPQSHCTVPKLHDKREKKFPPHRRNFVVFSVPDLQVPRYRGWLHFIQRPTVVKIKRHLHVLMQGQSKRSTTVFPHLSALHCHLDPAASVTSTSTCLNTFAHARLQLNSKTHRLMIKTQLLLSLTMRCSILQHRVYKARTRLRHEINAYMCVQHLLSAPSRPHHPCPVRYVHAHMWCLPSAPAIHHAAHMTGPPSRQPSNRCGQGSRHVLQPRRPYSVRSSVRTRATRGDSQASEGCQLKLYARCCRQHHHGSSSSCCCCTQRISILALLRAGAP
ncbi:hypothetical protein JOL62DRAFT_37260 [Phyllosticta paracitricarpa]|uniref:Uncharacterized protein n=2 Tax=Phyllosticta TaxID=121621 RepID=A0ABR1MRE2_9PEZI